MGTPAVVILSPEQLEEIVEQAIERALVRSGPRVVEAVAPDNLTVAEAAKKARCSPDTIRAWIQSGRLPRRRVGEGRRAHYRVSPADLEKAMQESTRADPVDPEAIAASIIARRRK